MSWKDHVQHVDSMLKLFKEKQLYVKSSNCFFWIQEVEYLGHIISHEGVKMDLSKIKVIKERKIHTNLRNI